MNIIIDSNIIIGDYKLKKSDSILFLRNFQDSGYRCFLSQITLDEILANFEKHLKEKINSFNSVVNKINRQVYKGFDSLGDEYLKDQLDRYKKSLNTKIKLHNIEILPIAEVTHEKILKQLFEGKHPFDNKDNGYKDFLIFESALKLINETNKDLIIITNDNDFGDSELHPDLKELNKSEFTIKLRKSFKEINENELSEQIAKYHSKLEFITNIFKEENHQKKYINNVLDFLEKEHLEIFPNIIYKETDVEDTPSLDEFNFFKESAQIVSVKPITEDIVIVNFEIKSYLKYLFTLHSTNTYQLNNFSKDIVINKTHEEYETFVELGYYCDLEFHIQADMIGEKMMFWNIEIKDNYR